MQHANMMHHIVCYSCPISWADQTHSIEKCLKIKKKKMRLKYCKVCITPLLHSVCGPKWPHPVSGPQGWSITSLNLPQPVLIPAEACRISVSFSLASLKGSLSSPFPFHRLLPAAHQLRADFNKWSGVSTYLIESERERERLVRAHVLPVKESRTAHLRLRDDVQGPEDSGGLLVLPNTMHSSSPDIHFLKHLSVIGGVRVSAGNLIQPLCGPLRKRFDQRCESASVQIESNPLRPRPPSPPRPLPLLDSHLFIIHRSTAARRRK